MVKLDMLGIKFNRSLSHRRQWMYLRKAELAKQKRDSKGDISVKQEKLHQTS